MPSQRPGQQEVCAWMSDAKVAAIDAEARRDGFVNAKGEPNRSAILRRLVDEALEARRASS